MEQQHVWIAMEDGTRLAARLFLPDERPAPVLLDAIPYRMDDLTASYASEYERLCEEGSFAVCRLDLRGTGSSEGIALDEYHPQEQADVCEVIAWLAAQPWSTGAVGMFGTSWGGFNAIQVAMEQPPALRAIVPIYASDDRYTDDVHYMGGILKAIDLVDWVLYMAACNVLPPVPAVYGDGWRDEWMRRIEGTEPWLLRWFEEQDDGPYWRHGSLRPLYDRITCPTMIVAGWADGYTNIALRAYEALRCPRRVLIGPWGHMSPATAIPGPHIDLVPELIRWFGRWLRGDENGIDTEPPIAVFMRRSTRPAAELPVMRGEWRSEPTWPAERLRPTAWRPEGAAVDRIAVRGDVGTAAWISCAGKPPWTLPEDQRDDDARSLVYDWPLEQELELLGHPRLRLTVSSPHPVAFLSARLCDVFPDGTSALVGRGVLNLTHRDGHEHPQPLEPGVPTPVELELEATSWIFDAGHTLRLALAGSDWPNTWPPPQAGTLDVDRASVELELPVLAGPPVAPAPVFQPPPPVTTHHEDAEIDPQPPVLKRIVRDPVGRQTRVVTSYGFRYGGPYDARISESYDGVVGVSDQTPGRAWASARARYEIAWPETIVTTEAHLRVRSSSGEYHVLVEVVATEDVPDGIGHVERRFERTYPRKLQ